MRPAVERLLDSVLAATDSGASCRRGLEPAPGEWRGVALLPAAGEGPAALAAAAERLPADDETVVSLARRAGTAGRIILAGRCAAWRATPYARAAGRRRAPVVNAAGAARNRRRLRRPAASTLGSAHPAVIAPATGAV
jgi:hypothetical protein